MTATPTPTPTPTQTASPRARRAVAAFTLVELLVVIGIIALLIGILLPTLSRARESAKMTVCLSNIRQMGQASTMFVNDHDGWMYKAWLNSGPKTNLGDFSKGPWEFEFPRWGWDFVLSSYMDGAKDVFACPSDENPFNVMRGVQFDPPDSGTAQATGAAFGNPNLSDEYKTNRDLWQSDNIPASYRYNASNIPWPNDAQKLVQIDNGTQAILITEGLPARHHHLATWENGLAEIGQGVTKNTGVTRHLDGQMAYMFFDGHGEVLTWEESWQPLGESFTYDATFSFSGGNSKVVTPPPPGGPSTPRRARRGRTSTRGRRTSSTPRATSRSSRIGPSRAQSLDLIAAPCRFLLPRPARQWRAGRCA